METRLPATAIGLTVNGRPHAMPADATVRGLVAELAGDAPMVAVERNGEIVPRGRWDETPLADGDHVELVRFVQGG